MERDKERLVEENLSWAYEYIRVKVRSGFEKMPYNVGISVESEVMFALCNAARRFDPSRNVKFRTYAEKCFENQLINAVKVNSRFINACRNPVSDAGVPDRASEVAGNLDIAEAFSEFELPEGVRISKRDFIVSVLEDEKLESQAGRLGLSISQVYYDRKKIITAIRQDRALTARLLDLSERKTGDGKSKSNQKKVLGLQDENVHRRRTSSGTGGAGICRQHSLKQGEKRT